MDKKIIILGIAGILAIILLLPKAEAISEEIEILDIKLEKTYELPKI